MDLVGGYSRSLWTSCAVKSLRIGWPAGVEEARFRLSPSAFRSTLVCGLFEDVFPAESELEEAAAEVLRGDVWSLCMRQTHHAREGLTAAFCSLEKEAVHEAAVDGGGIRAEVGLRVFLPPRSLNCAWTWLRLRGLVVPGASRDPDLTPWTGMPEAMADSHTEEGRAARRYRTVLSGSYDQHARLAEMVQRGGWASVRRAVHEGGTVEPKEWLFP